MGSDDQAIAAIIQVYFDSMYESDAEKVHAVFHANARITGYMGDALVEQTVAEFAKFVGAQQPSAQEKSDPVLLETLSLSVMGNTAVVQVRDGYLGLIFVDTLSFLNVDNNWVIYNKLFHVEA
jgi:hypothetical protein